MPDAVCLGEAVIDLFAPTGTSLKEAQSFSRSAGGGPANGAVCLARLGRSVGMIGRVGEDSLGAHLIELLSSAGVDTTHFQRLQGELSTVVLVASPTPEEQDFTIYWGADGKLAIDRLDRSYIDTSRVLLCGSTTLAHESRHAHYQAVAWAREAETLVAYDANLRPRLWPDLHVARRELLEGLKVSHICKVNDHELEFLSGTADLDAGSRWCLEQGPQLCVVTLGGEGVYFNNGNVAGHVPGFDVEEVDTTGCGDAFLAGLVSQILDRDDKPDVWDEATLSGMMRYANAVGALTATQQGAMNALPHKDAVAKLIGV